MAIGKGMRSMIGCFAGVWLTRTESITTVDDENNPLRIESDRYSFGVLVGADDQFIYLADESDVSLATKAISIKNVDMITTDRAEIESVLSSLEKPDQVDTGALN